MNKERVLKLWVLLIAVSSFSVAFAEQISFEVKGVVSVYDSDRSPILPEVQNGDSCSAIFTYELDTSESDDSHICCSYPHSPPTGTNQLVLMAGPYQFNTSSAHQYNVNVNNDRPSPEGNGYFYDEFDVNGLHSESPNFPANSYISVGLQLQSELSSLNALTSGKLPIAFDINEFDLPSTFVAVSVETFDEEYYDSDDASLRCHITSIEKVVEGKTDIGENILVTPPATSALGGVTGTNPVSFSFDLVETAGITTVEITDVGPEVPQGLQLGSPALYLNLDSSAVFGGDVEVCVDYTTLGFASAEDLSLLHYTGNEWQNITSTLSTASEQICGFTDSFSPFAVVKQAAPVLTKSMDLSFSVDNPGKRDTVANIGDRLTYTLRAKNTGDLKLTDVIVESGLLSNSRKRCRNLSPGRKCVLSGDYVVTQSDLIRGHIQHTATVKSESLHSVEGEHIIQVQSNPSLAVEHEVATSGQSLYSGDSISYSLSAVNTGDVTLAKVIVIDRNLSSKKSICNNLLVGERCVLTGVYTITDADASYGRLSNFGSVESSQTAKQTKRLTVAVEPAVVDTPVIEVPAGTNLAATNTSQSICIDTDGDGYGWDGQRSCKPEALDVSQPPEPISPLESSSSTGLCIDTDGDGWGWDGEGSCRMERGNICVDTDGDGWGWDGYKSCLAINP